MPHPPYGPDTDHADLFRKTGAAVLLEMGRLLLDHEGACLRAAAPPDGRGAEAVREEVGRKQEELEEFFTKNPKAAMRKHVLSRTSKKVDPRACRAVAFLGASMLDQGCDSVPIMRAARAVALSDDPADLLEGRRFVAALGTHGIVECGKADGLWHPQVRLGGSVMHILLGGDRCLAAANQELFYEVAAERRRRLGRSAGKTKPGKASSRTGVARLVESVSDATPRAMCKQLEADGYVGQEAAKRAVALAAYRHVQRLRRIHLDMVSRSALPPPANILCLGPTGCGKTFLMRTLFEDSLLIPTAILDLTGYSETGYVGNDVSSIPTHLLLKADGDVGIAQLGVVVLDEFDKLAEDGGGAATRVSRHGVQRSLLKLLDPGVVEIPSDLNGYHYRQKKIPFRTHDLLVVACGAFSALEAKGGVTGRIGFSESTCGHVEDRDAHLAASDFERYGLLPELVGRFSRWVRFDALGKGQLERILRENAIRQHRRELMAHGIRLSVDDSAVSLIVEMAIGRGTGARGIEAELSATLEEAAFEAYSSPGKDRMIRISAANGELSWDISQATRKKADQPVKQEELEELVEGAG
ncbi:AAA family ATPase [Verrucomicrobiota bacterium]